MVAADGTGRISYINRAAEALLDWPVGESVGQPLTLLIPTRLHAGEVRAESKGLGEGATFTAWLPLASSAPVA